MLNFKKVLNLRIVSLIITILFIFSSTLYSYPISEDSLRTPLDLTTYGRMRALASNETARKKTGLNRRQWLEIVFTGTLTVPEAAFSGPSIFAQQAMPTESRRVIDYNEQNIGDVLKELGYTDIAISDMKPHLVKLFKKLEGLKKDVKRIKEDYEKSLGELDRKYQDKTSMVYTEELKRIHAAYVEKLKLVILGKTTYFEREERETVLIERLQPAQGRGVMVKERKRVIPDHKKGLWDIVDCEAFADYITGKSDKKHPHASLVTLLVAGLGTKGNIFDDIKNSSIPEGNKKSLVQRLLLGGMDRDLNYILLKYLGLDARMGVGRAGGIPLIPIRGDTYLFASPGIGVFEMDVSHYYGENRTPGGYYSVNRPPSQQIAEMRDRYDRWELMLNANIGISAKKTVNPMEDPNVIKIMDVLFPYLKFTNYRAIAMYNLASIYLTLGRWDEAQAAFEAIVGRPVNAGDFDGELDNAIKPLDRQYATAYDRLGIIFMRKGNLAIAETLHRKAIDLNPLDYGCYINLATTHGEMGMQNARQGRSGRGYWEKARDEYLKSLLYGSRSVVTYSQLGTTYFLLGEYKNAVDAFLKAVKSDPNDALSYNGLGRAYYRLYKAATLDKVEQEQMRRSAVDNFVHACKLDKTLLDDVLMHAPELNESILDKLKSESSVVEKGAAVFLPAIGLRKYL